MRHVKFGQAASRDTLISERRTSLLTRSVHLEHVEEDIAGYGDEDEPAIFYSHQYSINDEIDENDGIDGHLSIHQSRRLLRPAGRSRQHL